MNSPLVQNSSFSRKLPGLQLGIDSTSLGEFKQCPRKYYYSIILGFQPQSQSVHLTFGLLLHRGREEYDRNRSQGHDHDDSLDEVIDILLRLTWNKELSRPWDSGNPEKNRKTLIRSIIWYLDQFQEDNIKTLSLANGRPAVELSFRFDSGMKSQSTGEPFLLCGHMDRVGELNGINYIVDIKTSKHQLSPQWFQAFTPDNQFSLYTLAGKVAFGFQIAGVIVDGVQVGATFARFQRGLVPRDEAFLAEWLRDTSRYLVNMEVCALQAQSNPDPASGWPMNDKACGMYGGCQFRAVCSRPPGSRQKWLESDYSRRVWDPLIARGDI